jgi:hypothetical protein
VEWNRELLEELLAPGITTFTTADIPDLLFDSRKQNTGSAITS